MKFNRRGSLGFPESIMAAMIVTLSLTAYFGFVAMDIASDNNGLDIRVDHRIFNNLELDNGKISGDIEPDLIANMERHGYNGISFICEVPGGLEFERISILVGTMEGSIANERFIFNLNSTDGRKIPTVMELAVCI